MGRYTVDDALREMNELRGKLLSRVERLVEKRDADGLARILVALNLEVERIESEARRLRLKGELDVEVYRALISGYTKLADSIWQYATKNGLGDDVRLLYIMHLDAAYHSRRERR